MFLRISWVNTENVVLTTFCSINYFCFPCLVWNSQPVETDRKGYKPRVGDQWDVLEFSRFFPKILIVGTVVLLCLRVVLLCLTFEELPVLHYFFPSVYEGSRFFTSAHILYICLLLFGFLIKMILMVVGKKV